MLRILLRCLLVLSIALGPALGLAQEPTPADKEKAGKLYSLANDAFKQGQFDLAARYLEDAYNLDPDPIIAYNLARSYEGLGRLDEAEAKLLEVKEKTDDTELLRKADVALVRVQNLQKNQIATGTLSVVTLPSGATVTVDNQAAGETPFTGDFPIGLHVIRIEKEGFTPHEETLTVDKGITTTLELQLKDANAVDPDPTPVTPPDEGLNGLTIAGISVLSFGAAGVIAGAAFYFPAKNQADKMAAILAQDTISQQDAQDFEDAKKAGNLASRLSVISYAIGFSAIGVGTGLLIWGLLDDGDEAPDTTEGTEDAHRNPLIPSNAGVDPFNGRVMLEWTF